MHTQDDIEELRAQLAEARALRDARLEELCEAAERHVRVFDEFADMVVPTPETAVYAPPLGEATETMRAVLAKVRP